MKKIFIWIIILAILAGAGYLSIIPVLPGELIVLKHASGKIVVVKKPGLYLHIPFKETYKKYTSKPERLIVRGIVKNGSERYSLSTQIVYVISDPQKIFPLSQSLIELKLSASFARSLIDKGNLVSLIKSPPTPKIKGIKIKSIKIFQITPSISTVKLINKKIEKFASLEIIQLDKKTAITIKKIENQAKVQKEEIVQKALIQKKNLLNKGINLEGEIISKIKYPQLWFLLKKVSIYSKAGTKTTVYLPLPLSINPNRR